VQKKLKDSECKVRRGGVRGACSRGLKCDANALSPRSDRHSPDKNCDSKCRSFTEGDTSLQYKDFTVSGTENCSDM
jgi:hypothetical protein